MYNMCTFYKMNNALDYRFDASIKVSKQYD